MKKEVRAKTVNILTNFLFSVNSGKINNQRRREVNLEAERFFRDFGKNIRETKKFLAENKDIIVIEADKSKKSVLVTLDNRYV